MINIKKPRIAIIGAGLAGLSCALECERNGIYPEIYERDSSAGWIWPSVTYWPSVFNREKGDIVQYLSNEYDISIGYTNKNTCITMKSAEKEIKIKGKDLGYFFERGKKPQSLENQMLRKLNYTSVHFNRPSDYKELSKKYDYVVVASGKVTEAEDLGVWEELGKVYSFGGVATGNFDRKDTTIYFNTDYAEKGYARLAPFNPTQALLGVYVMGLDDIELEVDSYFDKFLEKENLRSLEFGYYIRPPVFPTGRVSKFRVGNVLLAGRSAGLTDRLIGVGGYNAIISGVLAARSIIIGDDYDNLVKPLKDGVENISSIRDVVNNYNNEDYDKLITILKIPGLKQLIYNTEINFTDMVGKVFKRLNQ